MKLHRLMQLADSSLPLGGFAFSSGLEWIIKTSLVSDVEGFYRYLCSGIDQVACFDLLYVISLCAPAADIPAILEDYDDQMYLPLQRKASVAQGAAWKRLIARLFTSGGGEQARVKLNSVNSVHFLPLFALGLSQSEERIALADFCSLYVYMVVRDQVSAAIRLGAIGPSAGVELQTAAIERGSRVLDGMESLLENPDPLVYLKACRINPMTDVALADHGNLYAKLFQN